MNHRASSAWVIQRSCELARAIRPADRDDCPERQQPAQERQRDGEEKPDIAREDPGVPVQKKQARIERQGRTPADPR